VRSLETVIFAVCILLTACSHDSSAIPASKQIDAGVAAFDSGLPQIQQVFRFERQLVDGGFCNLLDAGITEIVNDDLNFQVSPLPLDVRFLDSADRLIPSDEIRHVNAQTLRWELQLRAPLVPNKGYFAEVTFAADSGVPDWRVEFVAIVDAGVIRAPALVSKKHRRRQ
jgi:hypothetical protein